jgi:hypothetical protein
VPAAAAAVDSAAAANRAAAAAANRAAAGGRCVCSGCSVAGHGRRGRVASKARYGCEGRRGGRWGWTGRRLR